MKVAVVTGSAKGLGKAMALALAKDGYTAVIHYNKSADVAKKTLSEVKKISPQSIALQADLKDEKQVEKMFKVINSTFKRVDILINNVGNFLYKEFAKTSTDEFKDIIDSNILTTYLCSRGVLPVMRKQKSGHIINIGSVGANTLTLREKSAPYFMAKNVVYYLTKVMAHEEARHGIHVNMISPASLETDIFKASDFPMGRSANYDDVVKVLRFLISPDAYYINGSNIEVAGAFIPGMT